MTPESIDLHLRISKRRTESHAVFRFELRSSNERVGVFCQAEDGAPIPDGIELSFSRLFLELESLRKNRLDSEALRPEDVEESVRNIGKDLYEKLLPSSIREVLDRPPPENGSLLVESNETWIPWEILHSLGEGGDFLCLRYRMGRWLGEATPPRRLIQAENALCIEAGKIPGYPPLPSARKEAKDFISFTKQMGLECESLEQPTYRRVMKSLRRGGYQILHFIGHGEFSGESDADRSTLILADRQLLPRDLVDETHRMLRSERPFVFLNACQAARRGKSLVGLGGWPETFLRRGHCAGFLAPQWSISSARASRFASAFWKEIAEGRTLGEAVRLARYSGNDSKPDISTLAYVFFGHPDAKLEANSQELGSSNQSKGNWENADSKQDRFIEIQSSETIASASQVSGPSQFTDGKIESQKSIPARRLSSRLPLIALLLAFGMIGWLWSSERPTGLGSLKTGSDSGSEGGSPVQMLEAVLLSIKHPGAWIASMLGLTIFLSIVLRILEKSKFATLTGEQAVGFLRFIIAVTFSLAVILLFLWFIRDERASKGPSKEEEVRHLVLKLKSDDPTEVRQAMEDLIPYGSAAADELVQAVREEAGALAAEMTGSALEGGFWGALATVWGPQPSETPFMSAAITLLSNIGEPAVHPVLHGLATESIVVEEILEKVEEQSRAEMEREPTSETNLIEAFGRLGSFMHDAGRSVRISIIRETLGRSLLGMGAAVVPDLLDGLESPRFLVRQTCFQVVLKMPEAHPAAASRLRLIATQTEDASEARNLVSAAEMLEGSAP